MLSGQTAPLENSLNEPEASKVLDDTDQLPTYTMALEIERASSAAARREVASGESEAEERLPQAAIDLINKNLIKLDHMLGGPRRRLQMMEHALRVDPEELAARSQQASTSDNNAEMPGCKSPSED